MTTQSPARRYRSGPLILGIAGVLLGIAAGCDDARTPIATPVHAYGDALEVGPEPDAATCDARIRGEQAGAARIRAALQIPGLASDPVTVKAAATDPTTDTSQWGIPLTAAELAAIRKQGIATDGWAGINVWVATGAPERFGGNWLTGDRLTVAVVGGDPATVEFAQCLAPAEIRLVWATVSRADGEAVMNRVATDMQGWRSRGVQINTVDYDETTGVVRVGATVISEALLAELQAQYGPLVRLVPEGPVVPG